MDKRITIENLTSSDNDSEIDYELECTRLMYPEAFEEKKITPPASPVISREEIEVEEDVPFWTYSILDGNDPLRKIEMPPRIISRAGKPTASASKRNPSTSSSAPPQSSSRKPEKKRNAHSKSASAKHNKLNPLSQKIIPLNELAVSKTKIKLLDSWMKTAILATKEPKILLLTGPTGSGKTASVLSVAADLNIRVIEWITPMDEFQDVNENRFQTTSQATKFLDFLLAGSRYQPVIGPSNPRKIILVEDYPNVFLRTPSVFHETLMKYYEKGRCPLLFITTDGKRKISLDLFPEKLIQSASIQNICFNSVADTFMRKAVDRIASRLHRKNIDPVTRNAICAAAMGDIRSAENIWNFQYSGIADPLLSSAIPGTSSGVKRKKGIMGPPPKKANVSIEGKDPGYEKLHCVARVLYAKRENAPVPNGSQDPDPRGYLKTDPNTITTQFLSERHSFIALAHENYPAIFSGIDQVAEAADNLSYSDFIAPENRMDLEHLGENSFSVAVRGFMNACTNPVTKWFPLKKSRFREVEEASEKFNQKVKNQYGGSPYTLTTAKVDMIPLLQHLEMFHPYDKTETGRHSPIPHISDDSDDD